MNDAPNAAQVEYWNHTAGPIWVELHEQLDSLIGPMGQAAIAALGPTPGEAILDIGCGCGRTSLQLAAAVGGSGAVVGADISAPMLAVARARPIPPTSARPDFREVDAQAGDLGKGVFDAVFSRFGVMFFADPVAAFANIRGALKADGRLTFVCGAWPTIRGCVSRSTRPGRSCRPCRRPIRPRPVPTPSPIRLACAPSSTRPAFRR
jgi:SAM-dependent methyltransferase